MIPPALRETVMMLSCASPMTVNTPWAAENVAVTAGSTRSLRASSVGTKRPSQGCLRPRGETGRGLGAIFFQNLCSMNHLKNECEVQPFFDGYHPPLPQV